MPKFQRSLALKLGVGAAAVVSIACMAQGIAKNDSAIKKAQVVAPLVRTGMEAVAMGSQTQNGTDVNFDELGKASQQFYDATNNTSWDSAQSIQAEEGQPQTGPPPDRTLTTISNGTPFDFLKQGAVGSLLGGACSTVGQALTISISFLGGPVSAAASLVVGQLASPALKGFTDDLGRWLAGKAVDVSNLFGSNYGYGIDYGTTLASNDQAIASGGRALSPTETAELQNTESSSVKKDFQSKSFAYRVLNPYDNQSLVSKVMDRTNSKFSQNIASLTTALFSFNHSFGSIFGSILSNLVHAQSTSSYDYGFPIYGFSEAEINSPAVNNPFNNARDVAAMVSDPVQGPALQTRVQKCFNVSIAKDSSGEWGVVSGSGLSSYQDINNSGQNCNDTSASWLKVRMFIFDTETTESIGCYHGVTRSCNNVGFLG